MTDQEINEAVARKLGHSIMDGGSIDAVICDDFNKGKPLQKIPDYCHSIKAAWEIVESMPKALIRIQWAHLHENSIPKWECIIEKAFVSADTAPMAIALAFLKLPV